MRPFDAKIEFVPIDRISPSPTNARLHSKKQIKQIANSITRFGWTNPILIDENGQILAGAGRYEAARVLGMEEAPVIRLSHMTEEDKRAYVIADNRLAEKSGWDREMLAIELQTLADLDFEVEATGFNTAEIDIIIDEAKSADPKDASGPEDAIPAAPEQPVARCGDMWLMGGHRLYCGNALNFAHVEELLKADTVDLVFTDPPYNLQIQGNVRRKGHREFEMASGEMTDLEFIQFLAGAIANMKHCIRDGGILFITIDWRHVRDLLIVADAAGLELKNICVWVKTNGGLGSLYRSQHELVCVFKCGLGPHINNIELGASGRNRTNVWTYAGVNSFKPGRAEELALHPTCKPVKMVQDAIEDVSRRNAVVFDPFGGSGTTLIAAERCGRRARVMEIDPRYCDVILRRFCDHTGKQPTLALTGETLEAVSEARLEEEGSALANNNTESGKS